MGMEFTFSISRRNSLNKKKEVWSETLVDLFESPDLLLHMKAYATEDEMRQAGYFPSFVEAYRNNFGSSHALEYIEDDEEREKQIKRMADKALTELLGESVSDDQSEDEINVEVNPDELKEWAEIWTTVLSEADEETKQLFLPYNHIYSGMVVEDLGSLIDLTHEAQKQNVGLQMKVVLG